MKRSLVASSLALALAACSPAGDSGPPEEAIDPSGVGGMPPSALRSAFPQLLIDPNQGGTANAVLVTGISWGRLVDVYDRDPDTGVRQLAYADFVIGESIASDGVDYELASVHGSQEMQLTILHPRASDAFDLALAQLQDGLVPIQDNSLPPFTAVPRNAAIELRFDDLLDPATVTAETIRLAVGYPPDQPFEARILAGANHGDLADPDGDGEYEFFPTRVIVDLAISELEALESDPPLAINALGLPGATHVSAANVQLRMPTRPAPGVGQTQILRNLSGNGLSFLGNGSNDPNVPTRDIVRSMRSGGDGDKTGDLYEGFLRDEDGPVLVGTIAVTLSGPVAADPVRSDLFSFPVLTYADAACSPSPEAGDRLQMGGIWSVVEGYASQDGTAVHKLRVRVVHPKGAVPTAGAAMLTTLFEAQSPNCYLGFSPAPASPPNLGVDPSAQIILSFSEPMRASSLAAFDGYTISRTPLDPDPFQIIVGSVHPTLDQRSFAYVPSLPLPHTQGSSEAYYVELGAGTHAPRDLAGNALTTIPSSMLFTLNRSASSEQSGGIVFRFDSTDEFYADGLPEIRGQHLFDLQAGVIDPRPVAHFSVSADVDKPLPSVMTPFPPGVQTPLTPLGCKLQSLWRYVDLGFSATDESFTNVDVEGLAWAPVGGQVITDAYDEFSIALGHSAWLPDEAINPMTGFPMYPDSGLVKTYADNYLPSEDHTGTVVHPRERGYAVSPADLFVAESGKLMMPWPLNRGIPLEDFEYYTWRDTAILDEAGLSTSGVPLQQEVLVLGLPPGSVGSVFPTGQVKTVGLPLLIEYRTYPDASALGLNAFEILLAANSSARPNFRAFSSGGINTNGQPVIVDPDVSTEASGGFNPNSSPPGAPTPGVDNSFSTGQIDLVTRISRTHSIWLPAGNAPANFAAVVISPTAADQPAGTQLRIDWRGATAINVAGGSSDITNDATLLDFYGDPVPGVNDAPQFLGGNATWSGDLSLLDGSSWIQFRLTFVGDPISGSTAELSSLGVAFTN